MIRKSVLKIPLLLFIFSLFFCVNSYTDSQYSGHNLLQSQSTIDEVQLYETDSNEMEDGFFVDLGFSLPYPILNEFSVQIPHSLFPFQTKSFEEFSIPPPSLS